MASGSDVCAVGLSVGCILNIYSGTFNTTSGKIINVTTQDVNMENAYYNYQDVYAYLNIYGGIFSYEGSSTCYGINVDSYSVNNSVNSSISPYAYANVSVYGGTVTVSESGGSGIYISGPCTVSIYGGEISGDTYGIYMLYEGDASSDTKINIYGGIISATADSSAGIYISKTCSCAITGGEISGGIGVEIEDGTVNISGGTISTTSSSLSSSGTTVSHGAAMYLSNGSSSKMEVAVSGGTFVGTFNCVIALAGNGASDTSESTLTFTGGVISSGQADTDFAIEEIGTNSSYITLYIEGGEFAGYISGSLDENMTITGGSFTLCEDIFDLSRLDLTGGYMVSVDVKYVTITSDDNDPYDEVFYTVTISTVTNLVGIAGVNSLYEADAQAVTYTGSGITFGINLVGDENAGYSVTTAEGTDAGEYIVYVTCADGYFFQAEDGKVLMDTTVSYTYTILQAANAVTLTIAEDGTYVSSATYGEVVYRYYADADCTQEITGVITTSGTYYVRAEVAGTDNYEGAVSEAIQFTVSIPTGGLTTSEILGIIAICILFVGLAVSVGIICGSRMKVVVEKVHDDESDSTIATGSDEEDSNPHGPESANDIMYSPDSWALDTGEPAAAEPAPAPEVPADATPAAEPAPVPEAPADVAPAAETAQETPAPAAKPASATAESGTKTIRVHNHVSKKTEERHSVTIPAKPKE
ncbi:MAG: hypothetical protein LUI04_01505 [Porphyromonadaceae bacterium]|nr:hypothetical protein [Porphyromonadaceae bacterium]